MANHSHHSDGESVADQALGGADTLESEGGSVYFRISQIEEAIRTVRFCRRLRYTIAAAVLAAAGINTCVARAAQKTPAAPATLEAPTRSHIAYLVDQNGLMISFDPAKLPADPEGWSLVIKCDPLLKDEFCIAATEDRKFAAQKVVRIQGEAGVEKLLRFKLSEVMGQTVIAGKGDKTLRFEIKSLPVPVAIPVPPASAAPAEAAPPVAIVGAPATPEAPAEAAPPVAIVGDPAAPAAPAAPAQESAPAATAPTTVQSESEPPSSTEWSVFGGVAAPLAGRSMGDQPDVQALVGGRVTPWVFGETGTRLNIEAEAGYAEGQVPVAEPENGRFVNPRPHVLGRVFEGGVFLVEEKGFRKGKKIVPTVFVGAGVGAELFTSAGRPDIAYDRDSSNMLSVAEGSSGIIPDVRAKVGGCLQFNVAEVCAGFSGKRGLQNVQGQAGSPSRNTEPYDVSVFAHAGYRSRKWR